jgi:hypothetical protein
MEANISLLYAEKPSPIMNQFKTSYFLNIHFSIILTPTSTSALPLGVKLPAREADHSPPSSAEFKNVWSYTSTPPYFFMAWCLVKHRDNFTFYLYLYCQQYQHGRSANIWEANNAPFSA